MFVFNFAWAHFSAGYCHAFESCYPICSCYVHCVKFCFLFLYIACYLVFSNKIEWNGILFNPHTTVTICRQLLYEYESPVLCAIQITICWSLYGEFNQEWLV